MSSGGYSFDSTEGVVFIQMCLPHFILFIFFSFGCSAFVRFNFDKS